MEYPLKAKRWARTLRESIGGKDTVPSFEDSTVQMRR